MEDSDLSSVCDIYPAFLVTADTIYTGVIRERLARDSDNNNASRQGSRRKLNKVKNSHEDDKNEVSIAPLDEYELF